MAYLGELRRSEQSGWAQLGRKLSGKQRPQRSLFDPPHYDDPADEEEPVLVRLKGVALDRLRDFGDVWLAYGLWRLLELDKLLDGLIPRGREEVPWATVAAILTVARFCKPQSELHIEDTWYRQTALDDLLSVPEGKVNTDRLYSGLDMLLPGKEALEKHLRQRLGDLFDLEYDLLLYDVTSTYFEGACAANPLAKRGYSRDGRPQCLQVCIGLVVTPEGIPLGYEVFPGNRNDAKTVEEIVLAMEKKYGRARRVWVMDRGMVSEDNLEFLRSRGGQYIVGTPKVMLRRFEEHLLEKGWHEVQEGVEVKLLPGPDGAETFVLARSADRRKKEEAMHRRFVERFETALVRMQAQADSGRLKDLAVANRRLGRLAQRNWRASGAFDVAIRRRRGRGKARLKITWKRDTRWSEWAALSEGCYLLRTNFDRNRSGDALETVYPAHRGRMGLPHQQGRTGNPPHLAPPGGAGAGPYSRLLPGLRSLEDFGGMDAPRRPGRCPTDSAGSVGKDQERRRALTDGQQERTAQQDHPLALCYRARRQSKGAPSPPRHPTSPAAATPRRSCQNVVKTLASK